MSLISGPYKEEEAEEKERGPQSLIRRKGSPQ